MDLFQVTAWNPGDGHTFGIYILASSLGSALEIFVEAYGYRKDVITGVKMMTSTDRNSLDAKVLIESQTDEAKELAKLLVVA